jgi:hypothetical protein
VTSKEGGNTRTHECSLEVTCLGYVDVKTESGTLGYPELSWKMGTDFPFAKFKPQLRYRLSFEVTLVRNSDACTDAIVAFQRLVVLTACRSSWRYSSNNAEIKLPNIQSPKLAFLSKKFV